MTESSAASAPNDPAPTTASRSGASPPPASEAAATSPASVEPVGASPAAATSPASAEPAVASPAAATSPASVEPVGASPAAATSPASAEPAGATPAAATSPASAEPVGATPAAATSPTSAKIDADERDDGDDAASEGRDPNESPLAALLAHRHAALGLLAFAVLLATALLGFLQFRTDELVDHDSLYHVGAANLLAHRGPVSAWPWMRATFLQDKFADKEFLFHVILAPFVRDESTMDHNAKVVTVVLGGLVFAAFALVLRSIRVKHAWAWLLVLLGASSDFLVRMTMTRPHLLAVALMLVGVKLALERRWLGLYFLTFIYTWSYSAPILMPVVVLALVLARAAKEQTLSLEAFAPVAASGVGIVSGLTLSPFGWNTFYVFYVQDVLVLLRAWGLVPTVARLGPELDPMSTRSLVVSSPGLLLAFGVGAGALLLARRRPSLRTVQLAATAGLGLLMMFLSSKLMDYAAPLVVLFAASAVDDQWRRGEPWRDGSTLTRVWAGVYAAAVVALMAFSSHRAAVRLQSIPEPPLRGAARWLRDNAPAGEVVAHFYWDDFSTLFHEDRSHYYLFGLDPTFMEVTQPDALRYLEAVRTGQRELNPEWFRDSFGAKWLVVPKYRKTEVTACDVAGLEPRYGMEPDETAMVYALPGK